MKLKTFCILNSAFLILAVAAIAAPLFKLRAPRSTDETNNTVSYYRGLWQYTNTADTNVWNTFANWPIWPNGSYATNITTNIAVVEIPATVPSLTWLSYVAIGTNGVSSARSASLLYNTNALWPLITNAIVAPRAPATGFITNN